jgi:hypothetical protein
MEIIHRIIVDLGDIFQHENKSRKPSKNTPEAIVALIVVRNRCLWVLIISGPVTA